MLMIGLTVGLLLISKNRFAGFLSKLERVVLAWAKLRTRLLKLFFVLILAILSAWFAIAYGTVLIVYLTWESLGWKILCILTLVFTAGALSLFYYACSIVRLSLLTPLLMRDTLEVEQDCSRRSASRRE
ncbi:hypothetical protein ACFQNF_01420 [Iodobacter arcticus]|uniref:Phage holin family protein n=1 Tax=Iodobacter arcticus TaxID=590593 RepID=A0ABW2QU05_9NEIS